MLCGVRRPLNHVRKGDDRDDSASSRPQAPKTRTEDESLLKEIRAGSEAGFAKLVARYERSMIRVARAYVRALSLSICFATSMNRLSDSICEI